MYVQEFTRTGESGIAHRYCPAVVMCRFLAYERHCSRRRECERTGICPLRTETGAKRERLTTS